MTNCKCNNELRGIDVNCQHRTRGVYCKIAKGKIRCRLTSDIFAECDKQKVLPANSPLPDWWKAQNRERTCNSPLREGERECDECVLIRHGLISVKLAGWKDVEWLQAIHVAKVLRMAEKEEK